MTVRKSILLCSAALALAAAPAAQAKPHEKAGGKTDPGFARCHAQVVTDAKGAPLATTAPAGYGPSQLRAAYALSPGTTSNQTIAIVDAYDLPTAASDLATYRSTFGLPPATFTKLNQSGGTTPPRVNASWGQEIALDLDMASAICPACKILLVEANSASLADLGTA